jgi:hypothetical protein
LMGSLPTPTEPSKSIPMRKLTATLCLSLTILFGSVGVSASADIKKAIAAYESGDYATVLREFRPLAEQGTANRQ